MPRLEDSPRFLTLEQLQAEVARYVYRDGWSLTVFADPWEGPCLYVLAEVPDAFNPGLFTELRIRSVIPPIPTPEYFAVWLAHRLQMIESHESREYFRRADTGQPVHDPHDPVEPGGRDWPPRKDAT